MEEYREIIERYRLRPKKKLGQNFLVDDQVIDRLISFINSSKSLPVLEVGPGLGFLTIKLVDKFNRVLAVELDKKLYSIVSQRVDSNNLELINKDILDLDIEKKFANQDYLVCSSLPYQISSPFIRKIVLFENRPIEMSLIVQLEVGERLAARPGSSSRGLLTVISQLFYEVELVGKVNPKSFYPQPKVDSVIVNFQLKSNRSEVDDLNSFFDFIGQSFRHKRKKIINSLASTSIGLDKSEWRKLLDLVDVESELRPEDLSNSQWLKIYHNLNIQS